MTIGQYIDRKRLQKGTKAEDLAAIIGHGAYADIVTDRRLPTLKEFSKLASMLNFSGSMGAKYRREITKGYRRYPIELEGDQAKTVIVLSAMTDTTPQEFITTILDIATKQLAENMNLIQRVEYEKRLSR